MKITAQFRAIITVLAAVVIAVSIAFIEPPIKLKKTSELTQETFAATFDSSLLPGGINPPYSLGNQSQVWKNLYLNNFTVELGKVFQPKNFIPARGAMIIGVKSGVGGTSCNDFCGKHTGNCAKGIQFAAFEGGGVGGSFINCSSTITSTIIELDAFCFCTGS